ncbi:MAG: molybdenum cofactor biosynthesis protein MoaE [Longimicrobiales bacterium]
MRAWVTTEPISAESVLAHVGSDADGAVCVFIGVVRDHNEGRRVRAVSYTAYATMAEKVLGEIAAEAAAQAGDARVAVVHRTGVLSVGEASVAIAVSSPHRAQAFDACRYIIEEIKTRVPVWKEERYAEGDAAWLDGTVPEVQHG